MLYDIKMYKLVDMNKGGLICALEEMLEAVNACGDDLTEMDNMNMTAEKVTL